MTYTLRLDWTGHSGESWIEIETFAVSGAQVTTTSITADANGIIVSGRTFMTYSLESARRFYKRCLADGYKPVDQEPELTYVR